MAAKSIPAPIAFHAIDTPFSFNYTADPTPPNSDPQPIPTPAHDAKIRELLRNISSTEIRLYSDGARDFMKLLRAQSGSQLLHHYVRSSSNFTELLQAWDRWKDKPGFYYIMSLLSVILGHPDGKYNPDDSNRVAISRVLDKFSRNILEDKWDDIKKELESNEGKRRKAALLLLGSIVRRGSLLATEVAKKCEFNKLPMWGKLSEFKSKGMDRNKRKKHSTRGAFIELAMSLLETVRPEGVKSVVQERQLFSGILKGLSNDDDETVVYVLSTLRDRVLSPESLVLPSLRSVLFGSATLEQLVGVSGREDGGVAAKVAFEVLVMVCTDPSNGLMPDLERVPGLLKGNQTRLVGMMKKLRATEVGCHRDLLLDIVKGRPSLASSYLEEFPYNLEDNASPSWVFAVTLAANVIRSVRSGISWGFLVRHNSDPLTFESSEIQSVLKCICPRPLTRIVINKGLLHPDPLIKHGTLRLLLEVLRLLSSFIEALSVNGLSSLNLKIQEDVQILLPDVQILFTLLSSVTSSYQSSKSSLKRAADPESIGQSGSAPLKKLKLDVVDEDIDILVGGLNSETENITVEETGKPKIAVSPSHLDVENGDERILDIWGSDDSFSSDALKDAEVYLYCKVLEALKLFHGALRGVLEVSYDYFKLLPSNPLDMPSSLLHSLLSMLIEYLGCTQEFSSAKLLPIYKHLQSFLNLWIQSSAKEIKEQAYVLATTAMRCTGAFDNNPLEIDAWLLFLPVHVADGNGSKHEEEEFSQCLSKPLVSFLCDAVSTVGNHLVKYWELLKCRLSALENAKDQKVGFGPLIICVLEKCLRLLSAGSGTFRLPEKSMISLYVCNTLKYLLQTQVEGEVLAAIIHQFLSEKVADNQSNSCEWRPLIHLFRFSRSILQRETYVCLFDRVSMDTNTSFLNAIAEVRSLLSAGSSKMFAISKALYFTTICTTADVILENLPSFMEISGELHGFHRSLMNYFYHDQGIMSCASKLWPQIFSSGLGMSVMASSQSREDIESLQQASFAFGLCLKEAPFHILFPATIFCGHEYYAEVEELLMAKLSNLTAEQIVSSLRLVLFWYHQFQVSYRKEPSQQLECFFDICYVLVEHILSQLSALGHDSRSSTTGGLALSICIQEVSGTMFCHPAVLGALSCPTGHDDKLSEISLTESPDMLMNYCGERVCKPELHVLNLLSTTCEQLVALCDGGNSLSAYPKGRENILKAFRHLIQRVIVIFKERFSRWSCSLDNTFFPVLYAILALRRFISPIELLELANWMLVGKNVSDSMPFETLSYSPLSLELSILCVAFDTLGEYLQPPNVQAVQSHFFWAAEERSLDVSLFKSIYLKVFDHATRLKLDLGDVCLLKSLTVVRGLAYRRLPPSSEMMRVIGSTPIKLLSHCIQRTNSTRARLLFMLTEMSPLHLSVFGCMFLNILKKDCLQKVNSAANMDAQALSDEEYLMLMPAAYSYMCSARTVLGDNLGYMLSFYSKILLDGFCNWKDFVSTTPFQVEYGNVVPSSVENLLDLFHSCLLGKAVNMLQRHFAETEDNMSKRVKFFCSIFPRSGGLDNFLDTDVSDIDSYSVEQLLNLAIRVIAKVSLSLVLLFPENNERFPSEEAHGKEAVSGVGFNEQDTSRVRLLEMLVSVWQWIVKKVPLASTNSEQKGTDFQLFRSLELFTLRCISKLIMDMHNHLIQMNSLPFVEKMAKVSLRYRFGDPSTLETLRCILSSLPNRNLPVDLFLQLLLNHSQLAPTIGSVIESSNCTLAGIAVKPISSFLRSLNLHSSNINPEKCGKYKGKLEVIKLLRLLFDLTAQRGSIAEDELGVNWKELFLLLLPSYGATMSEIDLEVYSVLSQIESARESDNSIIADLDYLWGSAALRARKENSINDVLLDHNLEGGQDYRRSQFRDNLPIDLKLLTRTILYFPYERTIAEKSLVLNNSHQGSIGNTTQGFSEEFGRLACYDPVFVLSFSIYSLSMGYLSPVEFAGLGLLALAVVSVASPNDGVRKLGYEVLGGLKDALNGPQKKGEPTKLKNLLAYFQNAIEEPWQKIPSIAAVFVAEASVILLDPSHDHYGAISKLVDKASQMKVSKINLESIPLFHDMFWSNSTNFKAERIWMLRLLYAGINAEDDGRIFIRNAVPETLLSVYASPFSSNEEKVLILQVLKKCIKVQNIACHLTEKCCLVSWLSSALSLCLRFAHGREIFSSNQLVIILEVVHEIVSSKKTMEWLEKYALEQLSDMSCHLFDLLIQCPKLVQEALPSVVLALEIVTSTVEISQKRKMCQPHFTLSMRSLYQLYQAVHGCDNKDSSLWSELSLKVILVSTPSPSVSEMGQQELLQFLMWAVATAAQSDSKLASQPADSASRLKIVTEEHNQEDSLISTLLRWLVASVILQNVSCGQNPGSSFGPREVNRETLLSLMENPDNRSIGTEIAFGSKEVLAGTIFHLQQLLGVKCRVLPSVVAALSILLLSDSSCSAGSATAVNCENSLRSLWSKVRYPPEANPGWRWSFHEPSAGVSPERTDLEKMEELHACQKALVIICGKLRKKSLDCQLLSLEELESSGLFDWERTNLVQE